MRILRTTCGILLLAALGAGGCGSSGSSTDDSVVVMTRNLYLGANLDPVIQAAYFGTQLDVELAATAAWNGVLATDFATRAHALALEIHASRPELVGLQEAVLWRSQYPADTFTSPTPATHVVFDFVQILLNALSTVGESYALLVSVETTDAEAPRFRPDMTLEDIRLTDRDVILYRTDAVGPNFALIQANSGVYSAFFGDPAVLPIRSGWCSVDFSRNGHLARFVNTHLESDDDATRIAQAAELLAGPLTLNRPTILLGDFNSDANGGPSTTAYQNLVAAGFTDVWADLMPGDPGITCCHDATLMSPVPFSDPAGPYRIDLVLLRHGTTATAVDIVGENPADQYGGLWPSDHAGIVAVTHVP